MNAEEALERGMEALRAGRAADAERLLREALAGEPGHVPAMRLLGTVLASQGRAAEGLEWLDRALAMERSPAVLHNRAQALFQLGRFDEARADLEAALADSPALHPSWNLLGSVRAALGDAAGAEHAYRRALELKPDHAETFFNMALALHAAGRLDEAIAAYRQARGLRADLAAARERLAAALNERAFADYGAKRFAEAVAGYREALALRPDFHEARNNLGAVLAAAGQHAEAIACFRAVLEATPRDAGAHCNLGYSLHAQGKPEAARRAFEAALAIDPASATALTNLGFLLQEEGRFGEAAAMYRRALAVDPQSATAAYNLGFVLLCEHRFAEGFEYVEWRYRTTPPMSTPRHYARAEFGADDWGRGHLTAIWGEQGVGDRLVYATLLPDFAARGERFILETDSRLVPAFARAHPEWRVVTRERSDAEFAACDRGIANASLPKLMRRALADFERQPRALLKADDARASRYRERLAAPGARLVGISWRSFQSAGRSTLQRRKSAALAHFHGLSQRGDLRLLDLQYGDTGAERDAFAAAGGRLSRLDELDLFNDIDGVLAAVEACDLVLTTSNVTAHFAGALGKRVLLVYLGGIPPFHYWATDASGRCLWYPSMRIVTGAALDTWEKVLAAAEEAIG